MMGLGNCLTLLALSRCDGHVILSDLLCFAGLIVLCCAVVLAVDGRRQNMLAQGLGAVVV